MEATDWEAGAFTHLDAEGRARMVDVGGKPETVRRATARGGVRMSPETFRLLRDRAVPKGDVLAVARIAGIMGAKQTPHLIPLCHPVDITSARVDFRLDEDRAVVEIEASVECTGRTGVEMEALTAVSVAALTIYDMCKAVDRTMVLEDIRLVYKSGGKSGTFVREGEKRDDGTDW